MSTRERFRRATGLLLVVLILVLCSTPQFRTLVTLPQHVRLPLGQSEDLAVSFPLEATIRPNKGNALMLNGKPLASDGLQVNMGAPISIAALATGHYTVDVRLFGLLPLRRMVLDVVPSIKLVPGGHSIGVLLQSRGVVIVGYAAVRDDQDRLRSPGHDGGIELGDTILTIDGQEVRSEEHVTQLFEEGGRRGGSVPVVLRRKGKLIERRITPIAEKGSGKMRVGLYIRDGAAGVGTLTFYDPVTGKYGALGHIIADGQTAQPIDMRTGHIVEAEVSSIQRGRKGEPGEKINTLINPDNWLGQIEKNTRFGIFGHMNTVVNNPFFAEPVPVAMSGQVKEGAAEMLTVVDGQHLDRYQIEIVRVMRQPTAEGKNMIIKITDPRLLEKTGGIVQGMSGSPILQDGRLVGAVTHVFVNDPTRGYAVLIEWMLQEAGVLSSTDGGEPEPRPATFDADAPLFAA